MSAIKPLLIPWRSPSKKLANGCFAVVIIHCGTSRPRHEYTVRVWLDPIPVFPVDLTKVTLDTVAHHGIAHFARNRTSQLSSLACPPELVADKRMAHPFVSVLVDVEVIALSGEPLFTRKSLPARHQRLIVHSLQVSTCFGCDSSIYAERRLRPFCRRRRMTVRPPAVDIRFRKPWSRFRLIFDG